MRKRGSWKILIICLLIVFAIALISSVFTSSSVNSQWYGNIKPSITPPNYVFPVVWNLLYFLIALSLYFSWMGASKQKRKIIAMAFGINLFLNVLWSFLFFFLQQPAIAFFDLILIWLTIWAMIFSAHKINKKSSFLLLPYLLWVSFAGVLNYLIAF